MPRPCLLRLRQPTFPWATEAPPPGWAGPRYLGAVGLFRANVRSLFYFVTCGFFSGGPRRLGRGGGVDRTGRRVIRYGGCSKLVSGVVVSFFIALSNQKNQRGGLQAPSHRKTTRPSGASWTWGLSGGSASWRYTTRVGPSVTPPVREHNPPFQIKTFRDVFWLTNQEPLLRSAAKTFPTESLFQR